MEPGNRKLIRPSLTEIKDRGPAARKDGAPKKSAPPDQTNAENFYYLKQMQSKTPMTIVLKDGETSEGRHRVVRQDLPEGESGGRAEPVDLQIEHQVHVQGLSAALRGAKTDVLPALTVGVPCRAIERGACGTPCIRVRGEKWS